LKVQSVLALCLVVNCASAASTEPSSSTTSSTPATLSGFIKSAVSRAVPPLGTILDLIWGSGSSSVSSSCKENTKQAAQTPQATNAVNTQVIANIQSQLKPIGNLATQYAVINKFLTPSVITSQQLIVMRTKLRSQSPSAAKPTIDWKSIADTWDLAKTQLSKIKAISDGDIDAVADAYLHDRLQAMRGANDTVVLQIGHDIENKAVDDLLQDVSELQTIFANMTAISGYEFVALQRDIQDLAAWAKGAAGAPTSPSAQTFIKYLDTNLPKSK
jgi:hypothetical protein